MAAARLTLAVAAISYAEHGMPVFPCKRDKKPKTFNGFHDGTTDLPQIREWWQRWPDASIGCVPGRCVPPKLVVDIDGPEGEREAAALGLLSEPAPTVRTGRGRHLWFAHPGGVIGNVKLGAHLDVRCDAGYVLLPPSIHPSGAVYRWFGKLDEVKPLPPDVLVRPTGNGAPRPTRAPLPARLVVGQRNDLLFSLGRSMRWRGASQAGIRAALEVENDTRCDPPLPADEVEQIATSAASYSAAPDHAPAPDSLFRLQQDPEIPEPAAPGDDEAVVGAIAPDDGSAIRETDQPAIQLLDDVEIEAEADPEWRIEGILAADSLALPGARVGWETD